MRQAAIAWLHQQVAAVVPGTADFYDAGRQVDIQERLQSNRPWVKLYLPSEEGDIQPIEIFLVTIDVGHAHLETARSVAEQIRSGLGRLQYRDPNAWRRLRIVNLNEGNFHRVQFTYRVRRPALKE